MEVLMIKKIITLFKWLKVDIFNVYGLKNIKYVVYVCFYSILALVSNKFDICCVMKSSKAR